MHNYIHSIKLIRRYLYVKFLKKLKKDVKCFELASKPYGFDFAAAKEPGIKIVGLPALPAKIKAKEAAKIMLDYVEGVL